MQPAVWPYVGSIVGVAEYEAGDRVADGVVEYEAGDGVADADDVMVGVADADGVKLMDGHAP